MSRLITCSDSLAELVPSLLGRRISTSRLVPRLCTCTSPTFSVSTRWRMSARLAGCWYCTSITVPPVNSTDRFSPLLNRKNTARMKVTSEIAVVSLP
ncbi:hypothetical protein D3C78_1464850 [compost metagenome]